MKYYKYMPFGNYTRLSLYMLFKESSVFFADKKFLNDPTDCNPNIEIDADESFIHAYAEKVIFEDLDMYPSMIKGMAKYLTQNSTEIPSITENYGAWKFFNKNQGKLRDGENIYKLFAEFVVNFHLEEAKVFSLSRTPLEPRMWAHYADSHRGICLEFELEESKGLKNRIGDVEYTTKRPTILASEIMSIPSGSDTASKTLLYNKMFLTKSNGWAYEQESRIYIPKSEESKGIITLDLPEGEYRRVPSLNLTGIIGGLNEIQDNSDLVNNLWRTLHSRRSSVRILRIIAKANSYDLEMQDVDDEVPF